MTLDQSTLSLRGDAFSLVDWNEWSLDEDIPCLSGPGGYVKLDPKVLIGLQRALSYIVGGGPQSDWVAEVEKVL